jgi:hypothetical protein
MCDQRNGFSLTSVFLIAVGLGTMAYASWTLLGWPPTAIWIGALITTLGFKAR